MIGSFVAGAFLLAAGSTIDDADCVSMVAQQAISNHYGYRSLGGMSWWNARSSLACQDEAGERATPKEELLVLARSHDSAAADLDGRLGDRVVRFCRLFVDEDIKFDPRKHLREEGIKQLPNEIVYVTEIYGGALFSLDCIASGQFGPMHAEPRDF